MLVEDNKSVLEVWKDVECLPRKSGRTDGPLRLMAKQAVKHAGKTVEICQRVLSISLMKADTK